MNWIFDALDSGGCFVFIIIIAFAAVVFLIVNEAYNESIIDNDRISVYHSKEHSVTCYLYNEQPITCLPDSMTNGSH